jgi:hypothetical protein
MTTESSAGGEQLDARPANAFGVYDSRPFAFVDLNRATRDELVDYLEVTPEIADELIALRSRGPIADLDNLRTAIPSLPFERIQRKALVAYDGRLHVLNVTAVDEFIFSQRPFALRVRFANNSDAPAAIVSVVVLWAGEPFVVEQELTPKESRSSVVDVWFDEERTLPVGPAEFNVALYRADGAQAAFRTTFYVLPSNPLSLSLSPAGATVTGTWSARGAYHGDTDSFLTECTITLANGDAAPVPMDTQVTWRFWDGGVGGTLVESGAFNWPNPVTVPATGLWQGGVWFSSPNGSGIYNKYHGKEDMSVEIEMAAVDGRHVSGTITCRVMLAYGVNIIKVGDFDAQEGIDLYDAVDVTRQIYERRDITFRGILRWIIHDAQAGGYRIINSEGEVHDLFRDWSVPNDFVDVFVCQDFVTGGFDGLSGGVPGPASKGGNNDGVAVDKTGFVDGSGTKRLDIPYLGMLIGHEVGHYLGMPHINEAGNLMLSNSGPTDTNVNYDQYRLMLPHGFLTFI